MNLDAPSETVMDSPIQRKIIHIDMDSFFASVEIRDNPDYATVPLAIGVVDEVQLMKAIN